MTIPDSEIAPTTARNHASGASLARILISCGIALVVFLQDPGRIVNDTKLDVAITPLKFLGHSLHMWDPLQNFGQVPNQAYGYLFPMGPFFVVGHALAMPTWVIQRLWVTAMLLAAFWGVSKLADALDIGTPTSRTLASLAYCLTPGITVFGSISYYILPFALLPWIMLPLVRGSRSGSTRTAAALSGIAVLFIGGANASAVLAVLPVPVLWLATRSPGPRRRSLIGWWILSVALACTWWAIPLVLQGRYAFNELPFTEQPINTTGITSLFETIRGSAIWTSYDHIGITAIQSGWQSVSVPTMVAASVALTVLGLFGITKKKLNERLWITACFAVGLVLAGSGYANAWGAPFAHQVQLLLAGPLAPLRNVWKFQPILVLALTLGLAHALGLIESFSWRREKAPRSRSHRAVVRASLVGAMAVVLLGAAAPFVQQTFYPSGSIKAVPSYWQQTSSWLAEHAASTTALVVPGSPTATYLWGRPGDEPLQFLAQSDWAVRSLIPDSSIGNIDTLDAINAALGRGVPNPGLSSYLAQSGIGYLVVRNDLDPATGDYYPPLTTHLSLVNTPGLTKVAGFGPERSLGAAGGHAVVQAVEIYRVEGRGDQVVATSTANPVLIDGNPNALLVLDSLSLDPGARPVFIGHDLHHVPSDATLVVSDTTPRVGVRFGETQSDTTYVLQPNQVDPGTGKQPFNWTVFPTLPLETSLRFTGIRSISASSYGATNLISEAAQQPSAAVDGDPTTAWIANAADSSLGQWLQVNLNKVTPISRLTLAMAQTQTSPRITQIRITTSHGSVTRSIAPSPRPQVVRLPRTETSFVRVTFTGALGPIVVSPGILSGAGIQEISIPGVIPGRTYVTPTANISHFESAGTRDPLYVFSGSIPDHSFGSGETGSDPEPHLSRQFLVPKEAAFTLSGTVVARPGVALTDFTSTLGLRALTDQPFNIACGTGLAVEIDGVMVPIQVHATDAQLTNWQELKFSTCPVSRTVSLKAGDHTLTAIDAGFLKILDVALTPAVPEPFGPQPVSRSTEVLRSAADARSISIGAGPRSYLVVRQNFNSGWVAHLGSATLPAVRINGWQQAWVVPSGPGGVISLSYAPDVPYRIGLLVGALLVLVLLGLAFISRREKQGREASNPMKAVPLTVGLLVTIATSVIVSGVLSLVLVPIIVLAWFESTRRIFPWLASLAFGVAGIIVLTHLAVSPLGSTGQFGFWPQLLSSVSIGVVLVNMATISWERPNHSRRSREIARAPSGSRSAGRAVLEEG